MVNYLFWNPFPNVEFTKRGLKLHLGVKGLIEWKGNLYLKTKKNTALGVSLVM